MKQLKIMLFMLCGIFLHSTVVANTDPPSETNTVEVSMRYENKEEIVLAVANYKNSHCDVVRVQSIQHDNVLATKTDVECSVLTKLNLRMVYDTMHLCNGNEHPNLSDTDKTSILLNRRARDGLWYMDQISF